ncbi:MAG: LacI family DNA-binding transcriptional regulator, partial [Caldilinea sp.]|nr:LacI family DNA-binding transcriptional regulator [Caldilinea sp.]
MRRKQEVTVVDVGKAAGVSPSTVSRVLNQKGYYSAEKVHKVHRAVEQLGYRVGRRARAAAGGQLFGLIIPDIANVFYTALADALLEVLHEAGDDLVLCVNNEEAETDRYYLEILRRKGVDGIFYTHPAQARNSALVRQLVEQGVPVVELNRQSERAVLDAVLPDNFRGMHQAVAYLAELGHRRIGFISGSAGIT